MTKCSRAWEVEAARDGRLEGKARDRLDAHVRTCSSCERDAQALDQLARDLAGVCGGRVDDVSLRRLRNRILDAVDAEQTGRVRSREHGARSRAGITAAFLVAAVTLGVAFGSWRAHGPRIDVMPSPMHEPALIGASSTEPTPPPAPLPESPSVTENLETRVEVSAADGARFTRTTEAAVDRFELADGTLRLRVQRPPGGRRVLVVVPDGEIEDVGTAFEVLVAARHTRRVSVHEGRVIVRLARRSPVTVEAGRVWERAPAKASASASVTPSATPSASVADAEREDAAYLDVLRAMREGRDGDARAAASRYLHDFPAGFRRAEMERVANAQERR